jgi:uracil-DNA glycosylase
LANNLVFFINIYLIISSLQNIFKEIKSDIPDFIIPKHGTLSGWARQGVLLLNACLTVEENKANSHKGKGWEIFTV